MIRFVRHWQALPVQNRIGAMLCFLALIVIVIVLVFQINGLVTDICQAIHPDELHR